MSLNNHLQATGQHFKWTDRFEGPNHRPIWYTTCFSTPNPFFLFFSEFILFVVDNVSYGTGNGSTKGDAREMAAYKTLQLLGVIWKPLYASPR
jgi:hypothetical protein